MKQNPADGTVRIGGSLAIPAVLASLGADPAKLLAEAGLDLKLFDDPENRISYAARGRLLSLCAARTGCRHFGLLVGRHGGLESLGLLGLLAKYSPDVRTALRCLVNYLHLHVRGAVARLAEDRRWTALSYDIYQPNVEAGDQIGDGAVAMMFNIVASLCGPGWKPAEVQFAHRQPEDVGPYRRFFPAPLVFDAERYAVVFASEWLDRRLPGADAELRRLLQKQIDALERRHDGDFPEQVRGLLRTALLTGHARADRFAALLSMHSRTLSRRLSASGTSFQALSDECRFEIARQMLEHSDLDVAEVAATLAYADASAFTRAFHRWSGTTPARWRARNRPAEARVRGSGARAGYSPPR